MQALPKDIQIKKQTKEDELQMLKERLELAIDANRDVIWDWNLETGELFVTKQWKDIVGYDRSEVPYTIEEWKQYIHPENLRETLHSIRAVIIGKENYLDIAYRILHKNGYWIWIQMRGKALYNRHGRAARMTGTHRDITVQKEAEQALEEQKKLFYYQANHDILTGLYNRCFFNTYLFDSIKRSVESTSKMALLFIDLDHFKVINDTLGHEAGDNALKEVSQRLSNVIEERDMLARLSGDEFTILRMDILDLLDVSTLAENVLKIVCEPIIIENKKIHLSASIGISLLPDDGEDARTLLKCADTAMYRAKSKGKNQYQFYLEPNE